MVKRYYVITAGLEVGVFYDHWTNVAHLVKEKSGAIWQSASSKEEAEELFEQASLKGFVRILPRDIKWSPTNSSNYRTSPVQRELSSSSTETSKLPSLQHASAPQVAGFHSEGHVQSNTPYYIPARANSEETNESNGNASNKTNRRNNQSSGVDNAKRLQPLLRTYSEPSQQYQNSNLVKGGNYHSKVVVSPQRHDNSTPSVSRVTARVPGVHRVRAESPTWLASYPDDEEEETFITPPLSPVNTPAIQPGLLGPSKSEPASRFVVDVDLANTAAGRRILDGRSGAAKGNEFISNVHSPKSTKPSALFSFTPQVRESLSDVSDGDSGNRGGKSKCKDERAASETSRSPTTLRRTASTQDQAQAGVESISELLDTVDRLVRLYANVFSPSCQTDECSLHDGHVGNTPCDLQRSVVTNSPGSRNENSDAISPRPNLVHQTQRPFESPNAVPSTPDNTPNPGVPSCSVLFSRDNFPTPSRSNSNGSKSGRKYYNRTGHKERDDTSILGKVGLVELIQSPDAAQDPRSPFSGSKKLRLPASPPMFGRPSPKILPGTFPASPSPLFASSTRRG